MSKLTKNQRIDKLVACLRTQGIKMRELETRLSTQEKWSDYADNMLTELNHALPDPEYDAKCEAEVADVEASLDRHRERLGLNKPQPKQLNQSVFNGLDEKWRFAAVDDDGRAYVFMRKPEIDETDPCFIDGNTTRCKGIGESYDASNWQNSLIEREKKELTGSELCKAMLARGDKFILCGVSDGDDNDAANHEDDDFLAEAVMDFDDTDGLFGTTSMRWNHAVPINNQGEPLTACEVGL